MLKFILLSVLLVSASAEVADWFTGRWLPVVVYPNIIYDPMCYWHDVSFNRDVVCSCGDRGNVNVMDFKNAVKNETDSQAVVVVESTDEIANVIALRCQCTGADGAVKEKKVVALQKLNDSTYVTFEAAELRDKSGIREPNMAFVIVKKVPKLTELRDLLFSQDHLKSRKPGLLCEPSTFNSDSSSTQ